ncbi:MAG: hypothetical protein ACXVBJ_13415, partial [Flavisolibacter sp.]
MEYMKNPIVDTKEGNDLLARVALTSNNITKKKAPVRKPFFIHNKGYIILQCRSSIEYFFR